MLQPIVHDYVDFANYCRSWTTLLNGDYYASANKPDGWFHLIMNFIGQDNGQGVRIYYDGELKATETSKYGSKYNPGDGRIVIGRYYSNSNVLYNSVQMDDLLFLNHSLDNTEIDLLIK